MGDLQTGSRGESDHPAGKKPQSLMFAVLGAAVEEELETQADAQARLSGAHGLDEGLAKPGPTQLGHGVGECAHAGQDHMAGLPQRLRVRGHFGFVAHRLNGLLNAAKITHSVIDDRDHAC